MKNIFTLSLSCLIVISLSAQTGPAGVGSAANNVIWLNADILTYSTVPFISAWPDQSGNGNDFTQSTSSRQPKRVTYPGFNGLRFDGGDWVNRGAVGALNTTNHTQYIVYNGFKPNHTGILFNSSFTQSSQFFRTYRSGGNINSWVLTNSLGTRQNTTTNSSSFQIISSYWDGAAQTWNSYKNGTSFGSKTGANGNPTGNYLNTVGAAANGSYRFDGDIGEIIIYNTVLNSAQRNIVDNYLSSKFGVTVSNDMYTYDGAHKYGLIGIGQEADGNNLTAQGKGIVEISVGSLSNGDYVLTGHNNTNLSTTTNDMPPSITGGSRLSRTWRTAFTGTPGNVDIVYDVSSLTLPAGSYYLLVESNNGVFNDGDVVTYGPFADVGGLVTFSGITLAEGDYFTLGTGSGAGIASIKTGDWDVASTWSCSCIPGSTDDVTVTLGHTVSATTITNVNDLTVNGTLNTLTTGNFNIKGDYTINASGSASHKAVTFNGSSAQDITSSASGTITFKNLYVTNSSGVTFQSGNFSVSGSLSITNGPLQNVGGNVTLLSNSSATAVILNGSGGFSGKFIIQRYISQRNASWGDLSSPVSTNHLRDWDSNPAGTAAELLMCGVNGFSGTCGGWNSVYDYDEGTQTYVAVTDTSYALTAGTGVEIWLEDTAGTLYNKTFDSRGTPNFGSVVVPVQTSWNLIGNPYQAWVSYSAISKPTIPGPYYIWNTNNASYDVNFSGVIPPNQAVWVESSSAGNVTFTESAKTGSGSSVFYKEAQAPYVEAILKVKSNKTQYAHELKLHLNPLASIALDNYDASFLPSRIHEAPSITAVSENNSKPLAVVSFNNENNVLIPITIRSGEAGTYVLEAIDFEAFNEAYKVVELYDHQTHQKYNLKEVTTMEIDLSLQEDENRFQLRLSNDVYAIENQQLDVTVYKSNEFTIIEFNQDEMDNSYEVSIVNLLGQKVINDYTNVTSTKLLIPNNQLPKGLNVVSVRSQNGILIKKINY